MICLIFVLIAHLNADVANDTKVEFRRYRFDSSIRKLIWQGNEEHDVLSVDWNEEPYPFGNPNADELNVFDKQGLSITSDTIAIKDYVDNQMPYKSKNQYEYYKTGLYEFQAAALAAYYGLNIVPSENYFEDCGPIYYEEELIPPVPNSREILPYEYPAFIVGINDWDCYQLQHEQRHCKTQCQNGDPIEYGMYGKDLLISVQRSYPSSSADHIKKIIAKFGPVLMSSQVFYGWRTDLQYGLILLQMVREPNDQDEWILTFNEMMDINFTDFTVAYAETFPDKATAYYSTEDFPPVPPEDQKTGFNWKKFLWLLLIIPVGGFFLLWFLYYACCDSGECCGCSWTTVEVHPV